MSKQLLPKVTDVYKPTLGALIKLGGSGSIEEMEEALISMLDITQEQLDVTYAKSGASILLDRMSWARSWLKFPRFIDNPRRGVWVLTEEGRLSADKSSVEIRRIVDDAYKTFAGARKAAGSSEQDTSG